MKTKLTILGSILTLVATILISRAPAAEPIAKNPNDPTGKKCTVVLRGDARGDHPGTLRGAYHSNGDQFIILNREQNGPMVWISKSAILTVNFE